MAAAGPRLMAVDIDLKELEVPELDEDADSVRRVSEGGRSGHGQLQPRDPAWQPHPGSGVALHRQRQAVTEIGLAVNDRRKNANGEWVEETTSST